MIVATIAATEWSKTMLKYKLTTQDLQTHNGFQWEVGKTVETDGSGDLCGPGWLHYYHDRLLAVLMNPRHADIRKPRLWVVEAEGDHRDDRGLKGSCTKMTLIREIELPVINTTQRVAFAILCAKQIYKNENWKTWADNWLNGTDRSQSAAYAAADAAADAAAADTTADTTAAAAYAADAYAADTTADTTAAAAADAVAYNAAAAADAAAYAAVAADAADSLDLIIIAQQAMEY